ncbi:ATP-binding protein [Comamonas sp. GB3 AK4-5]|uniref:ATP-binding protein n=1 Tax=Comamonas sp. GB3 AK4-5 TaxID=3231487 RepID=UPI00351EC297
MSNINIRRAIENIRSKTSVYTPIVEAVVNSIQSIHSIKKDDGLIKINLQRNGQKDLDGISSGDKSIEIISVSDNGIGFDDANRESFDTLYSDHKINEGGKGFGRLTYLKYFDKVTISSTYQDQDQRCWTRTFQMGEGKHFIVKESKIASTSNQTGTSITLTGLRNKTPLTASAKSIARSLVELLLPYFIAEDYKCPDILLVDNNESEPITLNHYLSSADAVIHELKLSSDNFSINDVNEEQAFKVRLFKIFSPGTKVSKISLVAHKREVEASAMHKYIPEFEDEFVEPNSNPDLPGRNYIVKAYVFSSYLDDNVSVERGGFTFKKESDGNSDLCGEITQSAIESEAAEFAKTFFDSEVSTRLEKKIATINQYIAEQAPWHKQTIKEVDFSAFPMHPTPEEIEAILHEQKFKTEVKLRERVKKILDKGADEPSEDVSRQLADAISESSKSELVHYVALRKYLLDLLEKRLEYRDDGKYQTEAVVHDIIFPRRNDSDSVPYEGHNLWMLDERLSFTNYVTSDIPLDGGNTDRSDVIVYGHRVAMRGENNPSNPVTIFEFKRPGRDDFTNPSSNEDPIAQIIRYTLKIRRGEFKTPTGREIQISDNTPFYGYVVCDLNQKVRSWLEDEKSFTPMPDRQGWFDYHKGANIYIEVISWTKLLNDAVMRNKIFFQKLGIN